MFIREAGHAGHLQILRPRRAASTLPMMIPVSRTGSFAMPNTHGPMAVLRLDELYK